MASLVSGTDAPVPFAPFAVAPQGFAPGLLALLAVAAAYFALGVGVGMLVRQRRRHRLLAILLIVPGALVGIGYLGWIVWTLI